MNDIAGQTQRRRPCPRALLALLSLGLFLHATAARAVDIFVNNAADLAIKAAQARPGDTLVMRDGIWPNASLVFSANGSNGAPITLRAETLGRVFLTGNSSLRIGGSHLVVDGLTFTNGHVTSGDVIAFQETTFNVAVSCRITNCAIIDYNPPDPATDTKWVSLYGFSNRVENCYFAGKLNLGTTLIIWVDAGNRPNYHQVRRNHFGPRPAHPVNGAETIRVGTSDVSLFNSRSLIEENYFDRCNGDAEIISNKSCENTYRHNTFVECEGSLSLRHGNRCTVEGNYFFGRLKPLTGGVRIVGEDHLVYNNYFHELAGTASRSPVSIMQGLIASPLNGYFQVQRATVAFNTFVNCTNPLLIGLVGTLSGSGETTTLAPVDCVIANNLALAPAGKLIDQRIAPVNFTWEGNILFGTTLGIPTNAGIRQLDPLLAPGPDGLWRPGPGSPALAAAQGTYPYVTTDIEGQPRPAGPKDIGADQASTSPTNHPPLRLVDVGPLWTRASGTVLSWSSPAPIPYGTPLGPVQLNAAANVPGTFIYTPPAGALLPAGPDRPLTVRFTPHDLISYTAVTQTVTLHILKALPIITWPAPVPIPYGTALGPVQLNATSSVPGTFTYAPPAGTILNVGTQQLLTTLFTPNDPANFDTVARSATLTVFPGSPALTWAQPAPVPQGTVLGPVQLNATASQPGTFTYTPPAGTLLNAGSAQPLTVLFTPLDTTNFIPATRTVTLDVTLGGRLVPILTWANPVDMTFGTPLGPVQLNATANVPGTFTYAPPAGTVLPIGNGQTLLVQFTPANTVTHTNATRAVSVNIAPPLSRATVRIAYIIPTNRVAQAAGPASLREAVNLHEEWFRAQMVLNGFGPKAFAFETEPDGRTPFIHVVRVAETDSWLRGDIYGGRITNAARAAGITVGDPGQVWWLIPETHLVNPDGSISGGFDLSYSTGGSGDDPGWAIMGSDALVLSSMAQLTNNTFYHDSILPDLGPYPLQQGLSFSWFEGSTYSSLSSSALGAGLRQIAEGLGMSPDYRNDENFDGNLTGFGFRGIRGALLPKTYPYNYARLPYGAALALSVSRYLNPGRPVTDTVKPAVTLTPAGTVAPVRGLLGISFTAADAGGLHAALLMWENDDEMSMVDEMVLSGTNVSRVFQTPFYTPGQTNRYTIAVVDLQGNRREMQAHVLPGPTPNRAPKPFVRLSPVSVGPGEHVVLDATQTFDPENNGSSLEVEWDLDGDGSFDTAPETELVYTNRYMTFGHRLVRARLTDPAGDQSVSAPVAVNIVPCAARLSPATRSHGYGSGSGGITVTNVGALCEWTAWTTNDWITITNGGSGVGPGRLTYAIVENSGASERVGHVMIGDAVFLVRQQSFACSYSISPTSRYSGFGAGTGNITVSSKPECPWAVENTNTWIQITSGASGTGSGTVAYALSTNRVSGPRTGYLTVAGQLFLVGQWGLDCAYILSPATRAHGEGSSTGLVTITTAGGCAWDVINTNSWITITTAPFGASSGSFGYSVAANNSYTGRTGTVELTGQKFVVTQAPCVLGLSHTSRSHGSGVEVGTNLVTTGPTCSWAVVNTNNWIAVIGGGSATGSGTFTYSVALNPIGTPRSGVLLVGNRTFTVSQLGVPCAYEVFPEESFHSENAEVGVLDVVTGVGCPWTVNNPHPWITLLSGSSGFGQGSVVYAVAANEGYARAAFISINGEDFQVNQEGGLRIVRLGDIAGGDLFIASGGTNRLAVFLDAHGTENRASVSLCFETNRLTYTGARLAAGLADGVLTVNAAQAAQGRVGFTVAMPAGWAIPPGNQPLLEASFRAAPLTGRASTLVAVCDSPVVRNVLDVLGGPVPTEYLDGRVTLVGPCTLAESVDAPEFTWATLSSGAWLCQTNVTHDGEDAVSSPELPDGGESWIEATFAGPGTLEFWWKVSSEAGSDRLRLYLDGSSLSAYVISGEVDWEERTLDVPSGSHVVRWRYNKGGSLAGGLDRAWLDQVRFTPLPPVIVAHPAGRVAELGSTVTFTVSAAGSPPLTYQWLRNGSVLSNDGKFSGAQTATLTLGNAQFADAAVFSVLVTSPAGSVTSSNASLSVVPLITLADAVDATSLVWATNGSPPWSGQMAVTHDGVDAAESGAIPHSGTTGFSTTLAGPGTLTFWWKVSSQAGSDRLRLYVNGSQVAEISGEVDWVQFAQNIASGNQTVEWRYTKNSSTVAGQDRGWVDEVRFAPAPPAITVHPVAQAVDQGAAVTLSVTASGPPPLSYQWRFNGGNLANGPAVAGSSISGATTAALTLSNVQPGLAGVYSVEVSNAGESLLSSNAPLAVSIVLPLADALDAPDFAWTTTGTPAWTGQNAVSYDGVDAARSGAIPHSGTTTFRTTVTGPGSVSFWWKASSEAGSDRLRFYMAGSSVSEISGEADWQWRTYPIASGSQLLEWRYTKNSSVSAGQDRGWVDRVVIVTNGAAVPPVIAVEPFSQTVVAGSAVSLRVGATGSTPLSYQWRLNGTNLLNGGGPAGGIYSGVTTTNLAFSNAQAGHAGVYSVMVSNPAGNTPSTNAAVAVITAPVITNQPLNQHVIAGSTVSFTVGAIGLSPLGYQWQFSPAGGAATVNLANGSGVSGATTATLTLTGVESAREGLYSVTVSNAAGSASSSGVSGNLATLAVGRSGAVADGGESLLNTSVSGPGTIRFWWKVSSETNSDSLRFLIGPPGSGGVELSRLSGEVEWRQESFVVPAGVQSLAWRYVKDAAGSAGQDRGWVNAVVYSPDGPASAPQITIQPVGVGVEPGGTVTFVAAVSGSPPLAYQWLFNGAPLANGPAVGGAAAGTAVSGATSARVSVAGVQGGQVGSYSLRVTNGAGSATSVAAALGLIPPAVVVVSNGLVILTQPSGRAGGQGGVAQFSVAAGGSGPFSYQWRYHGAAGLVALTNGPGVAGASGPNLALENLVPGQAGSYSVVVANGSGSITSAPASLSVASLGDAVEAPYWSFVAAGLTSWVAQAAVSQDGSDAARSGAIPDDQNTRLESWVEGPGSVSFWWKVSSQASVDQLRFYVGAVELARISGEVDWQRVTFAVPAGAQLLKWRYSKDASGAAGQDAGWVDRVEFVGSGPVVAPGITSQPGGGGLVDAGALVVLQAGVSGSAPLSYQWRWNGVALADGPGAGGSVISGARSPRLTVAGVLPEQAGDYSLVVSNGAGSATSAVAAVAVAPVAPMVSAPVVISQPAGVLPAGRSLSEGEATSFSVVAGGAAPLTYQWHFNGVPLVDGGGVSGSSTASLSLAGVRPEQIGDYWVAISNSMGGVVSARASLVVLALADAVDAPYLEFTPGGGPGGGAWVGQSGLSHERGGARLSVSVPPSFVSQPVAVSAALGGTAVFNAPAIGSVPLNYQWRLNGANLADGVAGGTPGVSGATSASLTVSGIQVGSSGSYSVVVTNVVGTATSGNALLTVISPPTITVEPIGQTVQEGATVVLNAVASGSGPFGYQWRYNGTNIANGGSVSGANTPTLTIAMAQAVQTGAYTLVVSNGAGTVVSGAAVVVVRAPLTLAEALNSPSLAWNTSISSPWSAQTTVSVDGEGATRSGVISSNQSTWLETTVMGPATLRFWWKVSSQTNGDVLQFLVDGVERSRVSGEVDWTWNTYDLPAGNTTLRWVYAKNATINGGQDRGWLDAVELVPTVVPSVPTIMKHPSGREISVGSTMTFTTEAVGTPPLGYQWTFNGAPLTDGTDVRGSTTPLLTVANISDARQGNYQMVVRNNYSLAVSSNAFLRVLPFIPLSEALDTGTTNLLWISGGASSWFGQDVTAYDRVDAAQSGALAHSRTSWMETAISGPVAINFWWKSSTQTNSDRLRFYINGIEQGNLSGEADWRWRTFDVNFLTATLRWAYTKDASGSAGQDAVWVDQIGTAPMAPIITNGPNDITYVDAGTTIKLRVETAGTPPFGFQWRRNGTNLLESTNFFGAETSRTLTMTNAQAWQSGVYSVLASNAAGVSLSETGHVVIVPGRPLPPALNTPTWIWRTGGDGAWLGDTADSHDGSEAGRSGTLQSSSGTAWMETTVIGPGQVRFWWKSSSRTNQDFARFYVNDTAYASVSGTPNWQQKVFDLEGATNVLKWDYTRNGILTNGQNRAWVDEVFYGPVPPVITNQPAGTTVDAGSTVNLSVGVRGTPPISYRWRLNGVNLSDGPGITGATGTTLNITGIQTTQAGNYSVAVNNAAGGVISSNAAVVVTPVLPLAQALDTTNLTWVTSGSPAGGAAWIGQTAVNHDGVDAARIANLGHSQSATFQAAVTGPGLVSFWWKVSSQANGDYLRFYTDGDEQAAISGEADWQLRVFTIPAGTVELRWVYSKNSSVITGQDRAWVDQVVVSATPPVITAHPVGRSVDEGASASFSAAANGTPPLAYQWRFNNANLANGPFPGGGDVSGATSTTLTLTGVTPAQAGSYSFAVRNAAATVVSSNAILNVATINTLAVALDNTNLVWATNGTPPWVGQTMVSHDGVDAARSGAIPDSGTTSFSTSVSGPGTVSYWWKVSSQAGSDRLRFFVNGTQVTEISGEVDWTQISQNLGSGTQLLEWRYTKNGSTAVGQDRAWVDEVRFGQLPPMITAQPVARTVEAGSTVSFGVTASGTPPFSYQWLRNGAPLANGSGISGATSSNLTLTGVQVVQMGNYSVTVANTAGSTNSASASLTVNPIVSLAEALDTTGLGWTTNGTPPWVGQTSESHDGVDAARSGAIPDSGTTSFSTTVAGPGTITFWWKVSSQAGSDRLRLYVNGTQVTEISGEVDWTLHSRDLTSGTQTLEWRYTKNGSISAGQDRGWVDEVRFGQLPPVIVVQPVARTVEAGSAVSLGVTAGGTPPLTYQWLRNGTPVANGSGVTGATTSNLTFTGVQVAQSGNYSVTINNTAGTVTSAAVALTVTPIVTLAEALDATGLTWSSTTTPPWVGQSAESHDGVDAARSGVIADDGTTRFSTTVSGPGTLTFWWKVSSQAGSDRLRFYLNGTSVSEISGEVDWTLYSMNLPTGTQTLEWRYNKNGSTAVGQDRAWVDEVRFGPAAPIITTHPASTSVNSGGTAVFTVAAVATPPVTYQWRYGGVNIVNGGGISGATTTALTLANVLLAQSGSYSVVVTAGGISTTSSVAVLTVVPIIPLAEALDAPGLFWSTGGSVGSWSGQTAVRHDGVDAAQSGTAGASQYTSITTSLTGPGTLSFWWKVSSEQDRDFLRLMLDGTDQFTISGEVDWQFRTFTVPAGAHELQWRFSHNASVVAGQDLAWVDQVNFTASGPPSPLPPSVTPPDPGSPVPPSITSTNGFIPVVSSIEIAGTKAVLTWEGRMDRTYIVAYKDNLSDPDWIVLDGEILLRWKIVNETIVPDSVIAIMEDVLAGKTRFYRVVEY